MKPCRQCESETNGYYTKKSRTCRKCTNRKLIETQRDTAERNGYKNYYQFLKFKNFTKTIQKTR